MKYKSPGRLFVPFLGLLPNHNTGLCPTSPFPPTFTASSPTQGFNILPTPLSPFSRSTPKPAASNNVCHVKVSILPLELYSCQISRMLNIISFHCIILTEIDISFVIRIPLQNRHTMPISTAKIISICQQKFY